MSARRLVFVALLSLLGLPRPAAAQPVPADTPPEPVNIVGTYPVDGTQLRGEVIFYFDKPLASTAMRPTSLQAENTTIGRTVSGDHWLRLYLDKYDEDAVVRIRIPDILPGAKGPLKPTQTEWAFVRHTLKPVDMVTLDPENGKQRLVLSFRYAMDPLSLKEKTAITHEGQPVPYDIIRNQDGRIFTLAFDEGTPLPVEVRVSQGLKDATGLIEMRRSWSHSFPPERDPLSVRDLRWGDFRPERQEIVVKFSRAVDPEAFAQHLTITGSDGATIPFEAATPAPGNPQVAAIDVETEQGLEVWVNIAPGLTAETGERLEQPFRKKLGRPAPSLRVNYHYWRPFGEDGAFGLYMAFTESVDAQDVQKHIRFEPEVPDFKVQSDGSTSVNVVGQWRSNTHYRMFVLPGLTYSGGLILKDEIRVALRTDDIPPMLRFGFEDEYYFPKRAGAPLSLASRNLDHAELTFYRLFPSNLSVALEDLDNGGYRLADRWMQRLASHRMDLPAAPDRRVSSPLDLDALHLGHQQGVFLIEAKGFNGEGNQRETDHQVVVWTNLGVLAHWQPQELAVYAHDLMSLEPAAHAKVSVYSRKNQELATGAAGDNGVALMGPFNPALGDPSVVVVETDNDYTFLPLEPRKSDPVAFSPEMPRYDREGYDAFIYADRDLYRPGETVHLRGLVRQNYGDAAPAMPLLLRVLKPNGQALLEETVLLSDLGTTGYDLATEKSFPTGRYTAQLFVPGGKVSLGRYAFRVEDFVPNRIKVDVQAPEGPLTAGESTPVTVKAEHLFGGAAADRRATVNVVFERSGVVVPGFENFHFGNDAGYLPETFSLGDAATGEDGTADFEFNYRAPAELTFPLKAIVVGRVFELGGRAVAGRLDRPLFPGGPALGVAAAKGGSGLEVQAAAVLPDGQAAGLSEVTVTLEKQVWNYYVRRYYSNHEARWSESFETVAEKAAALTGGRGSVIFPENLMDWGYYRIKVHAPGTKQFSTQSFYAWGDRYEFVQEARPSLIKLTLDKKRYAVGETAQLRIESPFDGTGIVVLQGESIRRMVPVKVSDGVGQAEIEITREHFPNVWAEVTVVHAVEVGKERLYPFSSFAMTGIPVDDSARSIEVAFPGLPEEMLPDREAAFTVTAKDAQGNPAVGEITLAAVDEGIHSVTGYDNPDPYGWLSRLRRPDFRRAHYYDKIAYDFEPPAPGGGLDALLGRRSAPSDNNWIKPLALWSAAVPLDASGQAQVRFTVPEFSGQLRLVAVAANAEAMGAGVSRIYVRRPYMLQTSQPRFLLPGDETQCRAVLYNRGDASLTATVRWSCSGAITGGAGSRTVEVPAAGEATVLAGFTAGGTIGPGTVVWEASIAGEPDPAVGELRKELAIPVRAPAAYQSAHEEVVLAPGESRTLKNTRFVEDSNVLITLRAGASPMLRLGPALRYVVRYPHGCIEQVTSRLFPMLLLRQHPGVTAAMLSGSEEVGGAAITNLQDIDYYLEEGVRRIFAMQTRRGGLATWPGREDVYDYGSIYAFHFLTLARNSQAIHVPAAPYENLKSYVRKQALDWTDASPHARYRRAYAVYTLALGGDLEALELIARFDSVPLPRDARYLLAAALALNTQDEARIALYLDKTPVEPIDRTETGGNLRTSTRTEAVELLALTQLPGRRTEAAEKANALMDALGGGSRYNTQEYAFTAAALASYLQTTQEDLANARFNVAGPNGESAFSGTERYTAQAEGAGHEFVLENSGPKPVYADFSVSGVPASPPTEPVSEGLALARKLFTRDGQAREWDQPFRQGDSYVVGLRIDPSSHRENLVVVDLLPAGLEIENPRLDADALPGGTFEGAINPSHIDLRDDRLVIAFDRLYGKGGWFYYIARAVTPGLYQHPPLEGECMYDARIHARTSPGTVRVE